MKYLLVSDIHGSLPALRRVLHYYDSARCDMLCLLGDILNYGPRNGLPEGLDPKGIAEELNRRADSIIAVRGNCDSEVDQMLLHFPMMADYAMLVDNGKRLFLTHGHIYNRDNQPAACDAIVCGHTHLWELSRIQKNDDGVGGTAIVNLGSPTFPKGGHQPTFATYEDGTFAIRNLDGTPLSTLDL